MSLPNYLAKIKSSGIYRFVWDKSEIAGVDAEILRLVVGYSLQGKIYALLFHEPQDTQIQADLVLSYGQNHAIIMFEWYTA